MASLLKKRFDESEYYVYSTSLPCTRVHMLYGVRVDFSLSKVAAITRLCLRLFLANEAVSISQPFGD